MLNDNFRFKLWNKIYHHKNLFFLFAVALFIILQLYISTPTKKNKQQFFSSKPFLSTEKYTPDEKRIANHFSLDTLPVLMKKGLIKKYHRNISGTCISVNGKIWKDRSEYFKHCLLTEVYLYNKINGYELSAKIVDSLSGKLYAQISSTAQINFYN